MPLPNHPIEKFLGDADILKKESRHQNSKAQEQNATCDAKSNTERSPAMVTPQGQASEEMEEIKEQWADAKEE